MARFERYGVLGTELDGVFFTESEISGAAALGEVKAESDRQNMPLDKLKRTLARQVKVKGGNALVMFTYGQRASIWSFSSTRITARGVAVRVEEV